MVQREKLLGKLEGNAKNQNHNLFLRAAKGGRGTYACKKNLVCMGS